ncbi:unnamed protein product [Gongylonema pulchrum]|uniref:HTH psq-type domain-containing protein n=1 Tax=Gongylonema pulchrum TaxID=637853 RepID=A0A183EJ33_9BILA|nr:unnamed protein product [Gongylonema pulchrum]
MVFVEGLPNSSFNSESLAKRLAAIYGKGKTDDGIYEEEEEEEQPLDLSSRRALQAATQSAASSVLKSRDGKRQRTSLKVLANKAQNPTPEERNDLVMGGTKKVVAGPVTAAVQPSMNKRNYSQADLDAAVRDIRCGRLGTRRASVVYGIPRLFIFHLFEWIFSKSEPFCQ